MNKIKTHYYFLNHILQTVFAVSDPKDTDRVQGTFLTQLENTSEEVNAIKDILQEVIDNISGSHRTHYDTLLEIHHKLLAEHQLCHLPITNQIKPTGIN